MSGHTRINGKAMQPGGATGKLASLAAVWPWEMQGNKREDRLRLLSRLRSALRAERRRGIAGHWSYDLARHAQLVEAYRAEVRRFMADYGGAHLPCGEVGLRRDDRAPKA